VPSTDQDHHHHHGQVTVLDKLILFLEWRRFILINFIAVTCAAIIVSLLLPKWYKATTTILPPKEDNLLNILGAGNSALKGLATFSKISPAQGMGIYNYFAILNSRSAMDSVINKFNLILYYKIQNNSREDAIKELRSNVSFIMHDDESLSIEVLDHDPVRASEMANYFTDVLNAMSLRLSTQEARNNREFIEMMVSKTKDSLRIAENSLKKYQETTGMMLTPDQQEGLAGVAELYGMKAQKEIQLAVLKSSVSEDNINLQQLERELDEINKKLRTLPQLGLESVRLYRYVLIEQKILEFIIPMYEQAKINEQKDVPVILVLDRAVPSEHKDRPKRMYIILIAAVFSLLVSALIVLLARYLSRLKGEEMEKYAQARRMLSHLKPDVDGKSR